MEENQNPQASQPQNEGNDAQQQPQVRRRPRIGEQRFRDSGNYESSPRPSYYQGGYSPRPRREFSRPNNAGGNYQPYQRPQRPNTDYSRYQDDQQQDVSQSAPSRPQYSRPQGGYGRPQQGGYGRQQQNGYGRRQQPQRKPNNQRYNQQRPVEYTDAFVDPNEELRLNKYLANAGVCSRREADEYIQAGNVKVNGEVVTELGTKVTRKDTILFNDQPICLERKIYVLLNKPKDTVTTSDDPQGRQTVMDLVRNASQERIYPVGRLDRNTTGVLLLTNDGDLASKLTHPKFVKKKIYHVWLDKDVNPEDLAKISAGIELEDGPIHADAIAYANEKDKNQIGIEIHSGKNRIVRRIFEFLGYRVTKLDRVYFAGLTKKNLPRGRWRHLTQQEVNMLKMGAFE